MVAPYSVSQVLQGAELKLLYRSFAALQLLRNLTQTSLLGKTPDDDEALVLWKAIHQLEEQGALLGVVVGAGDFIGLGIGFNLDLLFSRALPAVAQEVAGDSQKPGDKGKAAPLEPADAGKRLVENLGGQILGFVAAADAPHQEGIDAIEVVLIQLGKAGGVSLRRLDQDPFIANLVFQGLQMPSPQSAF